eukprot:767185-Hanusia_phi.AAC.2
MGNEGGNKGVGTQQPAGEDTPSLKLAKWGTRRWVGVIREGGGGYEGGVQNQYKRGVVEGGGLPANPQTFLRSVGRVLGRARSGSEFTVGKSGPRRAARPRRALPFNSQSQAESVSEYGPGPGD